MKTAELRTKLRQPTDPPTPTAGSRPHLITLIGDNTGRRYPLDRRAVIGRGPDVDIYLPDDTVSRIHATLEVDPAGRWILRDNGSRNGSAVNGVRISDAHQLRYGDRVSFGLSVMMLFCPSDPLEEQLVQSQKMAAFGQLAGGVAHDFNNLLTIIAANLALLRSARVPEGERHECLDDALDATDRAAQLARQLLDFARTGRSREEPVDFSALIADITQLLQRTFDRAIQVETSTLEGLYVSGDSSQLTQVLMNLCLNARDAMPQGGMLRVSARRLQRAPSEAEFGTRLSADPVVLLSVEDTGPGMDAETASRVFEPFFTTKEGKGLGLGLATAYGIVRNHGGNTLVESRPGEGTTFRVYLPLAQPPGKKTFGRRTYEAVLARSVLVIDDEPAVGRALGRLLKSMGCTVTLAQSGREGVAIFRERKDEIAAVVLDVIMPDLGGEETLALLREIDPNVKVLVTSGYSEGDKVLRMLKSGVRVFLQKPTDRQQLLVALRKTLSG